MRREKKPHRRGAGVNLIGVPLAPGKSLTIVALLPAYRQQRGLPQVDLEALAETLSATHGTPTRVIEHPDLGLVIEADGWFCGEFEEYLHDHNIVSLQHMRKVRLPSRP